jgi:hypothetical protein
MSLDDDIASAWNDVRASTDWVGMQKVGLAVAPSVAPTVLAAGLTPFLGPLAGPAVGGVSGEVVNNLIGLTKPSVYSYGMQAAVPSAMRFAGNVTRLWPAIGTTERAASWLNQAGKQELKAIGSEYQPDVPSRVLFERVGSHMIPMTKTKESAEAVLQRIKDALPADRPLYAQSGKAAGDITELFKEQTTKTPLQKPHPQALQRYRTTTEPGPGGLPAQKFQGSMATAGERLRAARRGEERVGGSSNVRNYSQLFSGYARDLEASPILKEAREAFKREQTLEDIQELAKPFVKKGVGETEQINVNQLMNQLKDKDGDLGRFFSQAFTPKEQTEILDRLANVNTLPGIGPGTGQAVGSSKVNPVIAAMLGAGGIGAVHGGGGAASVGEAAMGAAGAYGASWAGRMLRDYFIARSMPAGKAMIEAMLDRSGGKLTPEFWSGVHAFAASQLAQIPRTREIMRTP